ncbi:hypothetical protein EJB05_16473, partial [Eragrostis curvula]
MNVSTQQDDDRATWLRTQVIRIPPALWRLSCDYNYHFLKHRAWFDFGRGALLALYDGGGLFVIDIEREVTEKVMEDCPLLFHNEYPRCVPYELNLVDFFMLKLGGLSTY